MLRRCFGSTTMRAAAAALVPLARGKASLTMPGMDFLYNPTEVHSALRETVAKFAREEVAPVSREMDITMDFNLGLFERLGELGLLGVTIPEEDGGVGMDATAVVIIHHELSKVDPGFCLAYLAHSLLFVNNFYWSATKEQRERFLPKVLSGKVLAGMGMSEPNAGTDVLSMGATARRDGDNFVLNGGKTWITNGPMGKVFLVYAKVDGKVTAFLVERGMEGFTSGPKIDKCGMRASQMCQLFFDNVVIPPENVLGSVGKGVVGMMRNLEIERLGLAAMAVGIADECCTLMTKYANERKAFGSPLTQFGQMQKHIADSFAMTEAAKTLTYSVSRNVAPGVQNRIGSDAAKLFAAPTAKIVADNAMQVMGGMGYSRDMPVERLWRDAKLLEIGGGTNEAHHKNLTKDLSMQLK